MIVPYLTGNIHHIHNQLFYINAVLIEQQYVHYIPTYTHIMHLSSHGNTSLKVIVMHLES